MENKERMSFMLLFQHFMSKKTKISASVGSHLFSFKAGQPHIWDSPENRGSKEAWWSLSSSGHILPHPTVPNPPTEAGEVVVVALSRGPFGAAG